VFHKSADVFRAAALYAPGCDHPSAIRLLLLMLTPVLRPAVAGGGLTDGIARRTYLTDAPERRRLSCGTLRALYYTKSNALDGPLFARKLSGGDEREVVASVYRWDFFLADSGVYYVTRPDAERRPHDFELRRLEFGTGRTTVLNRIASLDVVGLTVSPDRTTIVTSGINTSAGDDLMLIRNFR
jgi:hypothetical protein